MQYNVFIVDDEPMIRYGLQSSVCWENEGLNLLGHAANGEAALAKLKEERVDILITDIKMPLMDGLELTRRLMQHNPHMKVILVSSYSDFEYAREAVKLGVVVDYLLKPTMEPEDLQRIVKVCKQQLDQDVVQLESAREVEKALRNTQQLQLEKELRRILIHGSGQIQWQHDWMEGPYMLSVWKQDCDYDNDNHEGMGRLLQLETAVQHLKNNLSDNVAFMMSEQEFVTMTANQRGMAPQQIKQFQQRLLEDLGLCFTVGMSPSVHELSYLSEAYEWACLAAERSFFEGKGLCYLGEIVSPHEVDDVEFFEPLRERFSKAYATADQEECEASLQDIFDHWHKRHASKAQIMTQAQSLLTMMWSRNVKLNFEDLMKDLIIKLQAIEEIATLQQLIDELNREFRSVWEIEQIRIIPEDAGETHVIQLALAYIQENYRRELSLQEVADHVHMSKNYFSEQFKRRTGMNFIDFIIQLRIHYAKQLLVTTSLKIYDIGQNSGFNSPKHFLKMFKREVQCTPAEYRQRQVMQYNHAKRRED